MTQRSGRSPPRQPEGTFDVGVVAIVAFFMRISPLYLANPDRPDVRCSKEVRRVRPPMQPSTDDGSTVTPFSWTRPC